MLIYLNCTANLGDFINSLPVLSGLKQKYGALHFIIRQEMRKFRGLIEFLMYQDLFSSVEFDDNVSVKDKPVILSSWTREDQNNPKRPIETCRYENWLWDNYKIAADVDDSFVFKVDDCDVQIKDSIYGGDRWSGPDIDLRRRSLVLQHLPGIEFLDYSQNIMTNAYIIKNCKDPFVCTFTGISGLADLLNKTQFILYGHDIAMWDNKPISYSFKKHYYADRNSRLMSIADFEQAIYGNN
jgi:hypothetical protein